MTRSPQKTPADLATRYSRRIARIWDEMMPNENAALLECQNCRHICTRITWIPEFEIEMCDTCRDEGMVALQKGPIDLACPQRRELADKCASEDEFRLALRAHVNGCVICGPGLKRIHRGRQPFNQATFSREGKVA